MLSWLVRRDCEVFVEVDAFLRGLVNLISWSMVDVCCGWVIFDPYGHECFYLRLMYVVHEAVGHFLQ